jgi:hypothetical protein
MSEQALIRILDKIPGGYRAAGETIQWFRKAFPRVTVTDKTFHVVASSLKLSNFRGPLHAIQRMEELMGNKGDPVVYTTILHQALQKKSLNATDIAELDEILLSLEPAGISTDSLAERSLLWKFLIARYYFVKGIESKALGILAPVLQTEWENKDNRLFALGMLGTYLLPNHPVLQAASTSEEVSIAVQKYKSAMGGEEKYERSHQYGGGNVWDQLHTQPVNRQALTEIAPSKKKRND